MVELTLGALLFAALGTFFVVLGIRTLRQRRQFVERGSATFGVVVDLAVRRTRRHSKRGGSRSLYHPVVEFTARGDDVMQFTSEFGTMPAWYKVGQQVQVLYDPENPQKAEIQSGCALWSGGIVFMVLGGVFACLGWAMVVGLAATGNLTLGWP